MGTESQVEQILERIQILVQELKKVASGSIDSSKNSSSTTTDLTFSMTKDIQKQSIKILQDQLSDCRYHLHILEDFLDDWYWAASAYHNGEEEDPEKWVGYLTKILNHSRCKFERDLFTQKEVRKTRMDHLDKAI